MLGIVITLLAVLAVICFAFHYSDNSPRRGSGIDAFLNAAPKYLEKHLNNVDLEHPQDKAPIVNHK
jgi:hypothetical protein